MYLKLTNPGQTWVLDIEANGLTPSVIWCVCLKNIHTEEERTFLTREAFEQFLRDNPDCVFIGHNIISYDAYHLNRLWDAGIAYTSLVDTLVLSYLFNPQLEGGHSLEAWGFRLGFKKGAHTDWEQFSEEMLLYCKNDVELTRRVYRALSNKLNSLKFSEKSAEIEHKIRVIIDEQSRHGFWFDRERATDFRNKLLRDQSDLAEQIHNLFPPRRTEVAKYSFRRTKDGSPFASYERHLQKHHDVVLDEEAGVYTCFDLVPFNLGSPKQRVDRLLELGWEPTKFTEKGFPKVDEDALVAFAEASGRREVAALAEWLVLQGRASMVTTWLENLGDDSRIHGRVNSCGAATRRMTHSAPNTANIPSSHKAKYGKECRAFWGVEPGKGLRLVGYDAAGLETAGLCHYLNSTAATEILLRPKPDDIHTANAQRLSDALGWAVDREWGAKTGWYAWLYGAYEPKLGNIVGGTKHGMSDKAAGAIVIDTFFRNVPGLKGLIDEVQYEFKSNRGRLATIDGGSVICPAINAALNYRVQSLGAILMKEASIILDTRAKEAGIDFHKVGDIHDEGQLECREDQAEQLGMLAVDSISAAGVSLGLRVPVTGDFKIGKNWSETH